MKTALTLRRTHRWAGAVLAIFMGVIALSGTVLQFIMSIYGDTGPMQAPGEPFWVARLRDLAVTIHTGAFAGMSGVYCSVICGLGLLFFTVTGSWMYLQVYRARATHGRRSVFWHAGTGGQATLRSLHRWMTVPIAVLTLFLAITGASLDLYFARYDTVPLPPPRKLSIQSAMAPTSAGPRDSHDAPPGPRGAGRVWHDLSLSLHKLNFLGRLGRLLGVAAGMGLTILAVSGGWMYLSMYRQRGKSGVRRLFW